MPLSKAKAHIFDFDGTIGDSMWVWEKVDREFLANHGIPYRRDYAESMAALGFEGSAEFFINEVGIDETPEQMIAQWQDMATNIYATEVMLKPGAREYLEALKSAGIPIAIATSLQRQILEPALAHNGVLDLFDAIVVCEEICSTGKSTPLVYERAAAAMDVALSECAVYEDVAIAAASAKRGGAVVVGVRDDHPQQNREALLDACDLFIQGFEDLLVQ